MGGKVGGEKMDKQKKIKGIIIAIVLLAVSIFPIINSIGADDYNSEYYTQADTYVSPNQSPGWYDATHVHTVAEGVANASATDTVYIWDGIYYNETVTVNKSLNIIGNSSSSVILNGSEVKGLAFTIESNYVNISHIKIVDYFVADSCAIFIGGPQNYTNISHCYIYNCSYGIYYEGSNTTNSTYLEIYNNTIEKSEYNHIFIEGYFQHIDVIKNNMDNSGEGVSFAPGMSITMTDINFNQNHVTNTSSGDSVALLGFINDSCFKQNNISYGNGIGLVCLDDVSNTEIYNNSFCGNRDFGLQITFGFSPNNISVYHNNFYNNSWGYVTEKHKQGYDEMGPSHDNWWNTSHVSPPANCGNFWDDFYKPSQEAYDRNLDGIIDSPYDINGSASQYDFLPLASPWNGTYPVQQESHMDLLNLTDLTYITGDDGVTWGYTYEIKGDPVWCNSSGIGRETIDVDLTINGTVNCSAVNVWVGDLYNSSRDLYVNASNIAMYVSSDNFTWFFMDTFIDGGCNVTINDTTWNVNPGNPWVYHGDEEYINESCDIYLRFDLEVPIGAGDERYDNYTRFTNVSAWTVYVNGSGPFDSEDFSGVLDVQTEWYRKPGYDNCTWGVPDFDQKQVAGTSFPWDCMGPDGMTQQWYMDGPTALCDCLWWLDCKRNPTGKSDKYWMPDFYGNGSKDKNNVVPTIEWMSFMMNTVGTGIPIKSGTTAENFTQGIYNIFDYLGVNDSYSVRTDGYREHWGILEFVPYENITRELDACQDVILLLGFWYESEGWQRAGGHYVQCNGHSRIEQALSFSDPYYDNAGDRGGWGWFSNHTIPHGPGSHNDTNNVSYDYYSVFNDSMSPGGFLYLDDPEPYPTTPPDALTWSYMNWWDDCPWAPPGGGDLLHVEIEMAWYICEDLCFEVNKTVWNGTAWVKEYENATVGETLNFNTSIHNCGVNSSHNITVWDTYHDGLRYVPNTAYITYANGTRVQRNPDWDNWEKGDCAYEDHGHLGWNLCGNETANLTYCSYIYIEYNLTLNSNNYTKNDVYIFICNDSCGCMWEDVLLENSSSCYVGQQFVNITCNCTNSNESSNWSVSEHINRNCTGDGSCLDEEWFEYETEFDRWCPYNTSMWMFEDWAWVYRYDNWDGNGTDANGLSWTIANESCINRSQSMVRMRVDVNDSLEPPTPWAIPFIGVIYSYTNNSKWDAVMYSYENDEMGGKPIVALLSKIGDYLYNTNDTTPVVAWEDVYNYWEADWSCNQTNVLDDDLGTEDGIWAKTIYNEYCGHVQAKAWYSYSEPFCPDSMGMCQEPSGWIYDNLMTNVENENATCFGLVVWNPLVQIGEEEFTRLDFRADFDFIEEWRLNYSFDAWATTAQKEAHCPEMGGNIPYQYLPCFDCVEYERQELAFAEIVHEWEMGNITDLTFYDASACHYKNKSNFIYDTSRSHRPIVNCLNEGMWNNQNDTIYYRTTIETNNPDEPDMLHFHIEDTTDGTNDSDDGAVICIDVDNDQVWGNNDLCFFWTEDGREYTVWNGTQVFSNSSQPEFDGVFTVAFDECMYSQAVASLQPLHRYSPHRQYSLSIPLAILQKDYFGSYDLLEAGDTIGLHMQTINSAETLAVPSISPVWENWNETACSFLVVPEDVPYLTWDTYMNISNEDALVEFIIEEKWNGTDAMHMQYWGQARIGDEYPLSNPWSINVTKESDIIKITDTSKNTTVVFNVTVCNNGTAPVTDVVVNDTFPFCCEYINSSLPVGNVSGNYTFNVTGVLDVDDCITFNITVNFTANCVVPNGTILNNIVYAFSAEGANATDSYGIQYGNNTAPVINWQYPINGSINVPLLLANISVNVSDADNDLMSIYFYTNKSDDTWYSEWNAIGVNLSVANGTYQCNQTFNNSQTENTRWRWGNTTYHWYVNVTDGKIWTNVSYSFTTEGSRYDINTDNWVDGSDLLLDYAFRTGVKSYYGIYDVNTDGWIDGSDLLQIYANRT